MHQGNYSSVPYYQYPSNPSLNSNPIPNPSSLPSTHASAPPFTSNYSSSDYSTYPPPTLRILKIPNLPTQAPNLQTFTQVQPSSSLPSYEQHGYQPPTQQQSYNPPYDQHQTAPDYAPFSSFPPNSHPISSPNPNPNPTLAYGSADLPPYSHVGSTAPSTYEKPHESIAKVNQSGGYLNEFSAGHGGGYCSTGPDPEHDLYGKSRYNSGSYRDDSYGSGLYAYQGSKVEPYGARGKAPNSSTWSAFDDFGRPIGISNTKDRTTPAKVVRAVPKADTQQDVKGGVQKFRVKLLAESGGQSTMDVLCQIGLDGIRMLDPGTGRNLRIYPLETVTKFEVFDPSTFAFWSKSSVDIESKRIRLQSNSYTTNTILDIVTAATVQLKEMGGRSKPADSLKLTEQPSEKKKGFADWMNLVKPANEEKEYWVPDEAVSKCTACAKDFNAFNRKHHCRNCGDIFCDKCSRGRMALTNEENAQHVRVCDRCMVEVTQRLNNAKEAAHKSVGLQSHEDLAKKLQEEMERNRKAVSSGSMSDGPGRWMKEVACPSCTVHLQVQVPASGSETIECGVCQHPFLITRVKLPPNMTIPAVILFGDSIIDQGNNNYLLSPLVKCNYPPYGKDFVGGMPTGRFSNGRTPPDILADELGIKEFVPPYLDPHLLPQDLLTGVSFASGANGYDPQTNQFALALSLSDQKKLFEEYIGKLKMLVGEERTKFILTNSLHVVATGTDDLANTYFTLGLRRLQYDINSYTDLMVRYASEFLKELYDLGARRIAIFGLPPIGCLPSQRTLAGGLLRECNEEYNAAAQLENAKLSRMIKSLNDSLHDSKARLIYIDIYNPMLDIIQNPKKYGFSVVDRGCCGTGVIEVTLLCNQFAETCPDDNVFLFWDTYHPTERGYRIIVGQMLQTHLNRFS
ncbi:Triacylglycerol lipase [Bertholletia excelsa]